MRARAGRINTMSISANSGMFISPITPSWGWRRPYVWHAPDRRTEDQCRHHRHLQMLTVTQNFNHQIGAMLPEPIMATLRLLMTDFLLGCA